LFRKVKWAALAFGFIHTATTITIQASEGQFELEVPPIARSMEEDATTFKGYDGVHHSL
jgi:hypothetical protein